ncbi:hypothetical protein CEXT_688041 [Caerostris extrusa]|uniref:Secreted protein n=1 Tax=Caerostris extrusa TaxID=172846 RepID=A0AAV4QT02_CAEEX|nr:hypothetical protein CEXT_688041 [Caerostris extrusa]
MGFCCCSSFVDRAGICLFYHQLFLGGCVSFCCSSFRDWAGICYTSNVLPSALPLVIEAMLVSVIHLIRQQRCPTQRFSPISLWVNFSTN